MSAKLVYSLLVVSVLASVLFVLAALTLFTDQLNVFVFNQKHVLNHTDKIILAKTLCIWLGTFLFILVTSVMAIRIYTGKFNASKGA